MTQRIGIIISRCNSDELFLPFYLRNKRILSLADESQLSTELLMLRLNLEEK